MKESYVKGPAPATGPRHAEPLLCQVDCLAFTVWGGCGIENGRNGRVDWQNRLILLMPNRRMCAVKRQSSLKTLCPTQFRCVGNAIAARRLNFRDKSSLSRLARMPSQPLRRGAASRLPS